MKVLHVIPSVSERSGGPGQVIVPMCQALREQGIDVMIVATDHGLVSSFEFQVSSSQDKTVSSSEFQVSSFRWQEANNSNGVPDDCESETRNSKLETRNFSPKLETRNYKGIRAIFFPVQFGDSFKYSRSLAVWLEANVSAFDVVHIHAVFNHACLAAARACRKHDVPYIVRPLGTLDPWSMKQKSLKKSLFWQLAAKRMMHDAAAVHYTSHAEKEATEQSLGLNHGSVVSLGIDLENTSELLDRASLTDDFSALATQPYVLVLSRLHPKKGLDILLDAFLTLVKEPEFREWRLVLAGEGPEDHVSLLKGKVQGENAGDIVSFPGWLVGERKNVVLRHAALLALPSYQENFGMCVMEAMACGVPVLVSPHVNLAQEIEAQGAGWIAEVDKDAIKTALAEALGNEDERARRGRSGKILAQNFSWDKLGADLLKLYESITAA
jgi:glycosyltransferase involved in cell wall biosynthesis